MSRHAASQETHLFISLWRSTFIISYLETRAEVKFTMPQWCSITPHHGDSSDDKSHIPLVFGKVWCGYECVTLTTVSSLSNQYRWGSISPPPASSKFIWIRVQWPCLKYGQHSPETCQVLYMQNEIISREPTGGLLWTISPTIDQWRAITWQDSPTCRLGSTRPIMIRLQSVHLNGHQWAWSTNSSIHRQCTWCTTAWRYFRRWNYWPPKAWSDLHPWSNKDEGS